MSDTQLTVAEKIFTDAFELERPAQLALLEERCGEDAALRAAVERMLASASEADAYFEALSERIGVDRLKAGGGATYQADVGQQFGNYRLTRLLGSGGMGAVWCAERADGRFEGEVAVKLLTRIDNRGALEGFDREAHYLARLTHPNIARLIDAGVGPDDVPYLILEYVEGEPIDQWCNRRALSLDERLRLLIRVADAVSHAHSRLVVHSDIKPANVLVTHDGDVKLLDFGISTLLDDAAGEWVSGGLTPEFAAPEQFAGEGVSTETDVYSLGLLLSLLLTGSTPRHVNETTGIDELRAEVQKEPPTLSSTLGDSESSNDVDIARRAAERSLSPKRFIKALRGDIDPIVRKALAVDPDDRYRNASEFAADLKRYLHNQPVEALPDTVNYRTRKFAQRHRGGMVSALLTLIALLAALGIATQQMFVARTERDVANYERQRVEASNEFYGLLLEEMGSNERPLTALELLDRGAELLRQQYDEAQPFMGRIQFDLSRRYASLAERDREIELLELAERAARASGDDDLLAATLCARTYSLLQSDEAAARQLAGEAMRTWEGLHSPTGDTRFYCVRMQARVAQADGDRDRAITILEAERRREHALDGMSAQGRALLLTDLALAHYSGGDFAPTIELLDEALATLREVGRGNTQTYMTLSTNKATVLAGVGEFANALEIQVRVLKRFEEAAWSDDRGLIPKRINHASTLIRLSRGHEARQFLERAREDARAAGDARYVGIAELWLASCFIELEDLESAERSIEAAKSVLSASPGVWQHQLFQVAIMRATIARKRNQLDETRDILAPLLSDYRSGARQLVPPSAALLVAGAARMEIASNNFAAGETLINEYLAIHEAAARRPELSAHVGDGLVLRATARFGQGNVTDAIADLERAIVALGNGLGSDNVETQEARDLLISYRNAL